MGLGAGARAPGGPLSPRSEAALMAGLRAPLRDLLSGPCTAGTCVLGVEGLDTGDSGSCRLLRSATGHRQARTAACLSRVLSGRLNLPRGASSCRSTCLPYPHPCRASPAGWFGSRCIRVRGCVGWILAPTPDPLRRELWKRGGSLSTRACGSLARMAGSGGAQAAEGRPSALRLLVARSLSPPWLCPCLFT